MPPAVPRRQGSCFVADAVADADAAADAADAAADAAAAVAAAGSCWDKRSADSRYRMRFVWQTRLTHPRARSTPRTSRDARVVDDVCFRAEPRTVLCTKCRVLARCLSRSLSRSLSPSANRKGRPCGDRRLDSRRPGCDSTESGSQGSYFRPSRLRKLNVDSDWDFFPMSFHLTSASLANPAKSPAGNRPALGQNQTTHAQPWPNASD